MENSNTLKKRAKSLGLYGIVAQWEKFHSAEWLPGLIEQEEAERAKRSLQGRTKRSKLGRFNPLSGFDWTHPTEIDRERIEQLFSLEFITDAANILFVGPSGVGKTMIAQNLAHHAVVQGYSSLFITASGLLQDLAEQRTGSSLTSRLKHYSRPDVLVIDELGYLDPTTTDAEHLFELVTRRYLNKPIILTSNKGVSEWGAVFQSSTCIVPMIDRLIHKSEILTINADESYRVKEARVREVLILTRLWNKKT